MRVPKSYGDELSLALTLDKNWLVKSQMHQPRYSNFIGTFTPINVGMKDRAQRSQPYSFYTPMEQLPSRYYQSASNNSNSKLTKVSMATTGPFATRISSFNTASENKKIDNFISPKQRQSSLNRPDSSFVETSSNLSHSHFKRTSEPPTVDQSRRRSSSSGKPNKYLTVVSRLPMSKKTSPFAVK